MILDLCWVPFVPPIHAAEHSSHAVQEPQIQSTSSPSSWHAFVPQDWDSKDSPMHGVPPFCADLSTYLDLSCMPPPHVAEHVFHMVQEVQAQLITPSVELTK